MHADPPAPAVAPEFIARIEPVVLVGGRSRRFGRDKLVEPLGGGVLIDRPIGALRAAFGPRVALVGDCDPGLWARADRRIEDPYPGVGPIGGVLAAIEETGRDVFVLAGDMPDVTPEVVRRVLARAAASPTSLAVLAKTDRPQPCLGLYRVGASDLLRDAISSGRRALVDAVPMDRIAMTPIDAGAARNVNAPGDL